MKYLIETFYQSIVEGVQVPIRTREILLTAKLMDTIFAQLNARRVEYSDSRHAKGLSRSARRSTEKSNLFSSKLTIERF